MREYLHSSFIIVHTPDKGFALLQKSTETQVHRILDKTITLPVYFHVESSTSFDNLVRHLPPRLMSEILETRLSPHHDPLEQVQLP